jgi:hypothetical protein
MNNEFEVEDAMTMEVKGRMKAAGELVWQRYPLPNQHPSFKSCPAAASRLLDAFDDVGSVLVMRDACLRHVREAALTRALTLAVPSRCGDAVFKIPASAIAGGRALRVDPLPQGSEPFIGDVGLVVVGCLAFDPLQRRLYTFEAESTAFVLDELKQGLVNGWTLPFDVPVASVASDQQQVSGWAGFARGLVEADVMVTPTRTLLLGP